MLNLAWFEEHVSFNVGNGRRTKFWKDRWCDSVPLNKRFPLLYEVSRKKNKMVAGFFMKNNQSLDWYIEPMRRLIEE